MFYHTWIDIKNGTVVPFLHNIVCFREMGSIYFFFDSRCEAFLKFKIIHKLEQNTLMFKFRISNRIRASSTSELEPVLIAN